jgi:hypothetical protein
MNSPFALLQYDRSKCGQVRDRADVAAWPKVIWIGNSEPASFILVAMVEENRGHNRDVAREE